MFVEKSWRLHPDWVYCEYNYAGTPGREFNTPEDNMKHFFVKMQQPDWNWGTPNVLPLPKCSDKQKFEPNCFKCKFKKIDPENKLSKLHLTNLTFCLFLYSNSNNH